MSYREISCADLGIAGIFVALAIVLSRLERLGLEVAMLVGAIRAVAQLLGVGYVLKSIFAMDEWYQVVLMLLVMIVAAARSAAQRVGPSVPGLLGVLMASITGALVVCMAPTVLLVLRLEAWYQPQYVIPISGMVIGNAMTAAALAVDRLLSELGLRRGEIEAKLSLGAPWRVASASCRQAAVRAALLPTVSTITVYGIVQLPGMMTGQIIGGVEPMEAVKYQVLIAWMLLGATTLCAVLVAQWACRRAFTASQQLGVLK